MLPGIQTAVRLDSSPSFIFTKCEFMLWINLNESYISLGSGPISFGLNRFFFNPCRLYELQPFQRTSPRRINTPADIGEEGASCQYGILSYRESLYIRGPNVHRLEGTSPFSYVVQGCGKKTNIQISNFKQSVKQFIFISLYCMYFPSLSCPIFAYDIAHGSLYYSSSLFACVRLGVRARTTECCTVGKHSTYNNI